MARVHDLKEGLGGACVWLGLVGYKADSMCSGHEAGASLMYGGGAAGGSSPGVGV